MASRRVLTRTQSKAKQVLSLRWSSTRISDRRKKTQTLGDGTVCFPVTQGAKEKAKGEVEVFWMG